MRWNGNVSRVARGSSRFLTSDTKSHSSFFHRSTLRNLYILYRIRNPLPIVMVKLTQTKIRTPKRRGFAFVMYFPCYSSFDTLRAFWRRRASVYCRYYIILCLSLWWNLYRCRTVHDLTLRVPASVFSFLLLLFFFSFLLFLTRMKGRRWKSEIEREWRQEVSIFNRSLGCDVEVAGTTFVPATIRTNYNVCVGGSRMYLSLSALSAAD